MDVRPRNKVKTAHSNGSEEHDQGAAPSSDAKTQTMRVGNPGQSTSERSENTVRCAKLEILEWPMDIIKELCQRLHPRDLLSLSQTSKGIRKPLLDRNHMSSIWAAALSNAPHLPPRAPSVSIPAFVHLLFSPYCHVCGVAVVQRVIWAWHMRCCAQCFPTVSYSWGKTRKLITSINPVGTVDHMKLHEQFPAHVILIPVTSSWNWKSAYIYSKAMVDGYVAELRRIHLQGRVTRETEISQLCQERVTQTGALIPYIRRYERWEKLQDEIRAADLAKRREQRFEEVTWRLREAGWSKELEFLGDKGLKELSEQPLIQCSSKLTLDEWVAIMGSLEGHLNKTRVQRIQVERLRTLQDAVVAHYAAFPRNAAMDCRPRYIEFAIADECRALVEAPVSQSITHEDFTTLIPRLATNWQEEKAAMLRQSLRSEFSLGERSEVDPLDLAIAMWVCTTCLMHLRYPAVLAHSCAYTPDRFDFFQDEYLRAAVYLNAGPKLCATLACKPYDFVRIAGYRHKKQVLDRMVGIVSAMGLEPKSATVKDLEECKVRLRCVRCREKGPGQGEVYGWEAAFEHATDGAENRCPDWWHRVEGEWEPVEEIQTPVVRAREAIQLDQYPKMVVWACALCTDWHGLRDHARTHLKDIHGLDDPDECVRDGTIYVHPTESAALLKPTATLL